MKPNFSWISPKLKVGKTKYGKGVFARLTQTDTDLTRTDMKSQCESVFSPYKSVLENGQRESVSSQRKSVFRKGERVIVFGGYVMTLEQLEKLPEYFQEYVYQIDDNLYFSPKENALEIVDYLNHSCNPNCGFKGQMFVIAMKDIKAGEEITVDYAMFTSENDWKMKCLCGFKNCRGIITGDDWKIKELQKKYKGYFQPYIQEKIDKKNLI